MCYYTHMKGQFIRWNSGLFGQIRLESLCWTQAKLLRPYVNKYLNYFWVMRYLDARHAFSKPCDLLSSPVSESLFISSSDPLWCPLFSLLLGFGTVWGKAVPDKEKWVCETLMKAKSHKLCVCPTCSLFYSYIFQSFYLLLFQGGYKKLDLQKGISHHEAL